MSQSGTISESVSAVAALLRAGNVRNARHQWRETLTEADPRECAVLAECGRILAQYPRTAPAQLRELWKRSDEHARAVIEACAPAPDEHRQRPEAESDRTPRWNRRNRYQAPRDHRETVDPEARRSRSERRARARRVAREESATVHDYLDTRAGTNDAPDRGSQPDGYAVDHDELAVYPDARDKERRDPRATPAREGERCIALACNLVTSHADAHQGDGLCEECREVGRPGLTAPTVTARCAYIAEYYPYPTKHLRELWQHSTQNDRDAITRWVAENMPTEHANSHELSPCEHCGNYRSPRDTAHVNADDGACRRCRADAAATPQPTAAVSA
ncbi:hypothetical protein FHR84_000470 [Actinopolyspora biskrensis]|uniref:Uncharacterized protein n=1 Tax=Actinopolyspora biskrensis TaxID=1470178 RepID=A0A852Z0H1_9ACTN|nr:hypothetical protein [Actinopolyspora biskrensis]NYH77156.1 hypothetical protein [Actinopolyspora biskrensis]